ncbi:porin family protein [Ancylomarina sp. 16SWW S1-10-2]|uniref:porin family protein n=1 Tax=Ancylomarina sp. 16SWW S1-10-2 TaxID=2499681 RepID=UPI0012ADB0B8|nr:porin family protein [Ancylomarina sp. 16SWW S1-10-2]MRT93212.1 PorT family protein [Ancylomarina sp. 16SWW S1-10-2]
MQLEFRKWLFLSLAIFSSLIVDAQNNTRIKEAYIIDKDTIYGEVKLKSNMYDSILFKKSGQDSFESINAQDIEGLCLENKTNYRRIRYKIGNEMKTNLFLQLTNGKANLYKGDGIYLLDNEGQYYYLAYETAYVENRVPKIDVRFKVVLLKALEDCEGVSKQVRSAIFSDNSLTRLVDYYNGKMGSNHEVNIRKTIVRKGVKLGGGINTISFSDKRSEYYNYDNSWGETFNLGFYVNFSKEDKPLSLQPELIISRKNTVMSRNMDQLNRKVELKSTQIQLPIMAYYELPYKRFTPVLSLGLVSAYEITGNSTITDNSQYSDNLFVRDFEMNKFSIGFRAGIGVKMKIYKKDLLLEYNYEHLYTNFDYVVNEFRFKSHTLSMSFDI